MPEPDSSLIAEFNARRSEEAFAALVRQHVNLVFATALRQVGDAGAAEEITQNVFVALAQAAGKLGSHPTIAGWLHQTALNKSREWLRSELRRRRREQVAVNLDLARAEGDSVWSPLVPLLDEALLELREPDRLAVILHFMEGRTFHEVGSVLGIGEDTARKRVNRCLEQLTHFFRRHGFAAPALVAGAPLFTLSSHAAPAGLAASAATAGLAAAHSAATSTLTLIKGALKIMAWTKAKTAIVVGVGFLLAASTTTVVVRKINFSPSNDIHAINNSQQVLITTVFLKVPTAKVDAVIHDFGEPQGPIYPNSGMFRNLLKQHPDVDYLGSPRILTADGIEGMLTQRVQVDGTNTNVGIILDVTPTVQPGSKLALKIRTELRELVDDTSPSMRVAKEGEQTKSFKPGETTIVIRKKIGDDGQTVGGNPNDGAETLLVFVNTALVKQRLQSIIKRVQP